VSQQALLARLVEALEKAGIPYMVSGSVVSSFQGEPRATHDIDIVIDMPSQNAWRLVDALSAPDLYLDEGAVSEAAATRGMFSLIDPGSGDKADFWLLTGDEFDSERFRRRAHIEALGIRFAASTPEDTILMKLRWAAESGGSEKQLLDAIGVYEVQAGALDEHYLDEWAKRLGVQDSLARVRAKAEPLAP
jgi:hypothetical protein